MQLHRQLMDAREMWLEVAVTGHSQHIHQRAIRQQTHAPLWNGPSLHSIFCFPSSFSAPLFISNYLFPRIFFLFSFLSSPLSHFNLTSSSLVFIILFSCLRPRLHLLPWPCLAYSTTASPVLIRLTTHFILVNIILYHIQSVPTSSCVHLVLSCLLFSSVCIMYWHLVPLTHMQPPAAAEKNLTATSPSTNDSLPFPCPQAGLVFHHPHAAEALLKEHKVSEEECDVHFFAYTPARGPLSVSSHLSLHPYLFLFPSLPFPLHWHCTLQHSIAPPLLSCHRPLRYN